jgi:rubrerythrin
VKRFSDLDEREILAVAIATEEEDTRVYHAFAEDLDARYPATAKVFREMADVENDHRRDLLELYEKRFGPNLVPIRREDVQGLPKRRSLWLGKNLPLATIRKEITEREAASASFYERAVAQTRDIATRDLLYDLATVEKGHGDQVGTLEEEHLSGDTKASEDANHRRDFVLQFIQPGLAGLMDGSVSTLAPLFAAAFATHSNWQTFLVGLAASLGAGISMGFAEALSDDGSLTGRGAPLGRGIVCGVMTAAGGLGHSLPYLVPDKWPNAFWTATALAGAVVFIELWIIAWVRAHYMDTPLLKAIFQIVLGGAIVLATGIIIGAS